MNDTGTVEVYYQIKNIPYTETKRDWEDAYLSYHFVINETGDGELKISKNKILPDEIEDAISSIEEQTNSWFMFYKFKSSHYNVSFEKKEQKYSVENLGCLPLNERITVDMIKCWMSGGNSLDVDITVPVFNSDGESSRGEFPDLSRFNNIDEILKRSLFTYIQTKELSLLSENYPDDMLKRWFLILEEIEENTGNIDYQNIKRARHFVSHSMCDTKSGRKVIDFLKRELAEAVYTNSENNEEARFDRGNQKHIEFVQKYAVKAEERARQLLMQQLEQHHD
ncbi:hypothetical protein [Candidatus Electrothrix sp.]|uniref:hypothetical protein n=1 Tax=Candidatus Electrothrix sp. TaxID=2170559 RepID=UPI0040579139